MPWSEYGGSMTRPADEIPELPPSEQPGTDDPWVVVTPMEPSSLPEANVPAEATRLRRRHGTLCPVCGAYFACEHDASS